MPHRLRRPLSVATASFVSLAAALLGGACGDDDEAAAALPAAVCDPGADGWQPGARAFVEATAELGLVGVEGTRLVAVDFDGDGWTDLHVHRGADDVANPDSFAAGGVRRSWLLRNVGGTRFEDVTEASGFRTNRTARDPSLARPGSVVAFADVDSDGDLDAVTGLPDPLLEWDEATDVVLNQGDGTFALAPPSDLQALVIDHPAAVVFTDVDRDGHVDLWLPQNDAGSRTRQDRLFRGDGTGRFTDVTDAAGLTTLAWDPNAPGASGADLATLDQLDGGLGHSRAWSGAACDLNGDGTPELLAASYGRAPNHLWLGRPDGSFVNRSVASGYAYDGDLGYADNQFYRCFCAATGGAACAGVPAPAIGCPGGLTWRVGVDDRPVRLGGNSGATICRDVDNDGHPDLLTNEIRHWWAGSGSDGAELLFSTGAADVVFERPGNATTGLVRPMDTATWDHGDMSGAVFDFDADGWPDVLVSSSDYPGTRAWLWRQVSPRRFERVPSELALDHTRSHGVAVADFDRDGDLDVVLGHSRARCGDSTDCYPTSQVRFFRNELGGNFVALDVRGGNGANGAAIGARVQVTTPAGPTQVQEVGGGFGHFGAQNDLVLHFGLGAACEADVVVRYPDAALTEQRFRVTAGHRFRVRPGEGPTLVPR